MAEPLWVDREQVNKYRLSVHHLAVRLPLGRLLDAAACPIQDTPPGSAGLALLARVDALQPAEFEHALQVDRSLVQIRCLRTAPHVIPTRDLPVFTWGLLPEDEEELRFFILGAREALDTVGISATDLVNLAAAALLDSLDGRSLAFRALSADLTARVAAELAPGQVAAWQSPGPYAPGQSLGEALIHFALYALALQGLFCFAGRIGDEAAFARVDQWLVMSQSAFSARRTVPEPAEGPGASPKRPPVFALRRRVPAVEREHAQSELVRRYLHYYGPSTPRHFGEWAGVAPTFAGRVWARVEPDLIPVEFEGRQAWLHREDLRDFETAPRAAGVLLLPPHDPYLAQRDRATLLPDVQLHSRIWRITGNPGVVLADGRVMATWRPQKKGKRLRLVVSPLAELNSPVRSEIEAEAGRIASWRGAVTADVSFE